MSFQQYSNIGMVVKTFQVRYEEQNFITETPFQISDYFRDDLELTLSKGIVNNSENAICENLIYPVLKEVWKRYVDEFLLWSHQTLHYNETLTGVPDYMVARRSPLGKVVFDKPYLIVVEAKRDDFTRGWGQCLVELIAAQKLNDSSAETVFGVVSNGLTWEFGQLIQDVFTKHIKTYSLQSLDELFAALNHVFEQCRLQLSD
ncbi:hypothetical protein QUF58_03030 [Anaerolineales bacterium HSG24]|nr:hypothetical protein [Anaerolineales bacterium HSG24]